MMENESKKLKGAAERIIHYGSRSDVIIPDNELETFNESLITILEGFMEFAPDTAMSGAERQRMLGSGVRRYGFIDKVSDIAKVNPEFIPPFLDIDELKKAIRDIEDLRNISVTLQQLLQVNNDLFLIISNNAFRLALMYYNTVRDASRRRVPGAEALFRMLQPFFRRPRRTGEEPTEMELERDVKALLHGKKDGRIVIENETPRVQRGKHLVVDDTHKERVSFRESEGGEVNL